MTTQRPDKAEVLSQLKGFQRTTVDHVVRHLLDPAGSKRFLVADEVGLGKTLVARGVTVWLSELPPEIVQAMRLQVAHLFLNREAVASGQMSEVALGFRDMLKPWRVWL